MNRGTAGMAKLNCSTIGLIFRISACAPEGQIVADGSRKSVAPLSTRVRHNQCPPFDSKKR